MALLQVLGCGDGEPAATGQAARQPTGSATGPVSRTTGAAQPYATPQQPTADGVTVRPVDPRISVVDIPVTATDGAAMMGYAAQAGAARIDPVGWLRRYLR